MKQTVLPMAGVPIQRRLDADHYLGRSKRVVWTYEDEYGVMVWAKPTSRRLPSDGTWLELTRWCLVGTKNGGSTQWGRVKRALLTRFDSLTTCVSYSDPSQGHTGALYRACNWQWAPTWHRLSPPPTGHGSWRDGRIESVKDRWVFALRPDDTRTRYVQIQPWRKL